MKTVKKMVGQEVARRPVPTPPRRSAAAPEALRPTRRSQHVLDLREPESTSAPIAAPAPARPAAPPPPVAPVASTAAAPAAPIIPRRPWSPRRFGLPALKVALVVIGAVFFLSLNVSLPERLIGIYFVIAVVYAIDSQRTFLVALVFLVMVAVWSALGNSVSAEDYAIYAFYFLVIGLVSAIRELVFSKSAPAEN